MKATQQIVSKLNEMIAAAPTPEQRLTLASIGSSLLMAVPKAYQGYSYVHWLGEGFDQWVRDGKPEDTTPYLGDKTMVRFF
jgi:hypothetical protein